AVTVEVLLTHEVEIARRQSAARRPSVTPRCERLALGIRIALHIAVALALAVSLQVVPPAIAEIGAQVLERAFGMDIAVEDADARLAQLGRAARGLPELHVHGASSISSRPPKR